MPGLPRRSRSRLVRALTLLAMMHSFQLFALLCSLARSACVIGPLEPFEPPPHCCALRAAAPPWSGSCFLLLPLAGLVETFWFILCLHRCGCTDATGRGRAGSANRSIA